MEDRIPSTSDGINRSKSLSQNGESLPEKENIHSKFRLFISSTFSDFSLERDILQTEVFPEIEIYCAERGYQFQAIDLRWGVSEEAQIDQRTIEVCINEVRACRSHSDPNFLILIGDRYGWVPLPTQINCNDFRLLSTYVTDPYEVDLLCSWYVLDNNHIPATYFLKRREGEFLDFSTWNHVEEKLRSILHRSVYLEPDLLKRSSHFFHSATEQEIQYGLDGYHDLVTNGFLSIEPELNCNKFAFLRSIDSDLEVIDPFEVEEVHKTTLIKNALGQLLPSENILHSKLNKEESNTRSDLPEFKRWVLIRLKEAIDYQIGRRRVLSDHELEHLAHERYLKDKVKHFVGRSDDVSYIKNYLNNPAQTSPLFLVGASGQGKSSLLASVIDHAYINDIKIVYRFIGATPHSTDIYQLLHSILFELGDQSKIDKRISFKKLCSHVQEAIRNLQEPYYIFIDALDQLLYEDHLFWLDETLSPHVKFIATVLNDEAYSVASKTYHNLIQRFEASCFYYLRPFKDRYELINKSLASMNRKLTQAQQDFIVNFVQNPSPLYLSLSIDHAKSWTSTTKPISLPATQLESIKCFIIDLSNRWYHNAEFVERVFSYLYLSVEGLSESELIELLSYDTELVRAVAPETYHENLRKKIPFAIWSRLYDYCHQYFINREHNGFDVFQLSHREFKTAVKDLFDLRAHSEKLLRLCILSIKKWQSVQFDKTRIGLLFIDILTEHQLQYHDELLLQCLIKEIVVIEHRDWLQSLIVYLDQRAQRFDYHFDPRAHSTYQILDIIYDLLPEEERTHDKLADFYFRYGGYQYLHVSWPTALITLEKSTHHFEAQLRDIDPDSEKKILLNGEFSQVLGRIGEMAIREAKQDKDSSDYKNLALQKGERALRFYKQSEPMLIDMLNRYPNDSECSRKLGVLYERIAIAYQVLEDVVNMRIYFDLAIQYKGASYDKETGKNAFTMRKIWLIIAKDYLNRDDPQRAEEYILRSIHSIREGDLSSAIINGNQYYIEQFYKVYSIAVSLFTDPTYQEMLEEINYYYKERGLKAEY